MSAERKTQAIPEWKREEVDDIVGMLDSYESVGIVNIAGIPSRQLQDMRRELHGSAELRVSRNTLLERALAEADLDVLSEHVHGQVGIIATNDNPFGLFQTLEASKTPAPIGAGEIAPNNIVIPEGDTGVDPGPFVGDLQQAGAAARIMDGSIQVTEDSTVLEAGGEVSQTLANVLGELGIEPKEVGLDLRGVYSDGVVFSPEELEIDVDEYRADIESAAAGARNLSVNAVYPTDRTAGTLLANAAGEAKALGIHAAIESPALADDLVAKADAQLRSLAVAIDDEEALPEELRDIDVPETDESTATDETETDEEQSGDQDAAAETDDADEDDDDDSDGGEGLGAMFG